MPFPFLDPLLRGADVPHMPSQPPFPSSGRHNFAVTVTNLWTLASILEAVPVPHNHPQYPYPKTGAMCRVRRFHFKDMGRAENHRPLDRLERVPRQRYPLIDLRQPPANAPTPSTNVVLGDTAHCFDHGNEQK